MFGLYVLLPRSSAVEEAASPPAVHLRSELRSNCIRLQILVPGKTGSCEAEPDQAQDLKSGALP
jgi:hypothetical protein